MFRLLINDDGLTAFPTYEQLRPYLGMQPGKIASRETIAKALKVLRLTRWLSLGRRLRNDLNGQHKATSTSSTTNRYPRQKPWSWTPTTCSC